jgi:hypothetical protein
MQKKCVFFGPGKRLALGHITDNAIYIYAICIICVYNHNVDRPNILGSTTQQQVIGGMEKCWRKAEAEILTK